MRKLLQFNLIICSLMLLMNPLHSQTPHEFLIDFDNVSANTFTIDDNDWLSLADGSGTGQIGPGDIVYLKGTLHAKLRIIDIGQNFTLTEMSTNPVIIKPYPLATERVVIAPPNPDNPPNDPDTAKYIMKFQNCKGIIFSGEHSISGVYDKYGIRLDGSDPLSWGSGLTLENMCSYITIDKIEISHVDNVGIKTKWEPGPSAGAPNWYNSVVNGDDALMNNITIQDCYIHDTGEEGMYLGETTYYGLIPSYVSNVTGYYYNLDEFVIQNNRLTNIGWDAIQVSSTFSRAYIHNNYIFDYGTAEYYGQ